MSPQASLDKQFILAMHNYPLDGKTREQYNADVLNIIGRLKVLHDSFLQSPSELQFLDRLQEIYVTLENLSRRVNFSALGHYCFDASYLLLAIKKEESDVDEKLKAAIKKLLHHLPSLERFHNLFIKESQDAAFSGVVGLLQELHFHWEHYFEHPEAKSINVPKLSEYFDEEVKVVEEDDSILEVFKDPEIRESFKADALQALQALDKELSAFNLEPKEDALASVTSMLKAMHTLRGAAALVGAEPLVVVADDYHRLLEVAQSFIINWTEEAEKAFDLARSGMPALLQVMESTLALDFKAATEHYQSLKDRIYAAYSDYYYTPNEKEAVSFGLDYNFDVLPDIPEVLDDESFDSFLDAYGESDEPLPVTHIGEENSNTEISAETFLPSTDKPAEAQLLNFFFQESKENIEQLEKTLLVLEKAPGKENAIKDFFRVAHSTKGAANSMGMFRIGKIMHVLENLFELLLEKKIPITSAIITASLQAIDGVNAVINETQKKSYSKDLPDTLKTIFTTVESLVFDLVVNGGIDAEVSSPASKEAVEALEEDATETDSSAESEALPVAVKEEPAVVAEPEPQLATTAQSMRVDTSKIDSLMDLTGELVINRSRIVKKISDFEMACEELQRTRLRLNQVISNFQKEFEYSQQHQANNAAAKASAESSSEYTQGFSDLEFDRYDEFNVLSRVLTEIGYDADLSIARLQEQQREILEDTDVLGRITSRIQDTVTSVRMVSLDLSMNRLERAVRDACNKENKTVLFESFGRHVSLDKAIIEQVYAPLLHLVRNSVSHGFSQALDSATDAEPNCIKVLATQEGSQVVIDIVDNGDGIDFEKVRDIAQQKGLIASDAQMSKDDLIALMFMPGFSTHASVTEVSGRGIGLDVVKTAISRLNGSIDVQSAQGEGTTFRIRLPLTLAIDQAIYFKLDNTAFALPVSVVVRVDFAESLGIEQIGDEEILRIEDETVPVLDMHALLGMKRLKPEAEDSIIICQHSGVTVALRVHEVLDKHDIVIKELGPFLEGHPFFNSATISGDGQVIPILDISGILSVNQLEITADIDTGSLETEKDTVKRVLVVDDSLSVRKVCESYLTDAGFIVDTANDGLEALEKLKQDNTYDTVITDLEMPRLSGLELIGELRRLDATRKVPVIVITSRSTEKHRKRAIELGANGYLGKPFTRETVVSAVNKFILKPIATH